MRAVRLSLLALSISTRSLLLETKAISMPEKKAENSNTMMQLTISIMEMMGYYEGEILAGYEVGR